MRPRLDRVVTKHPSPDRGRPTTEAAAGLHLDPLGISMPLELLVARGAARGLINGTTSPDYGQVIALRKLLLQEGDRKLALGLLRLAEAMDPTPQELSDFGPAV